MKKDSESAKHIYKPVSILSKISKVCERIMFKQMSEYFECSFFSKYHCGFRKSFRAQHCLVSMLEKWKSATDNGRSFEILLTGLPKAFDCLSHDLLIAQLNAYGPLFFSTFLCDLFLIMDNTDIASYADDNAPYTRGNFFSGLVINK